MAMRTKLDYWDSSQESCIIWCIVSVSIYICVKSELIISAPCHLLVQIALSHQRTLTR